MPVLIRRPFVFLRHGQSTRNLEHRIGGQHDVALTPQGEEEARRARALLGDVDWSLVAASPLQRAYRTAELALGRAPDRVVDGLMERHWGELEGQAIPETIPYMSTPAGGESWEAFVERIADTLNALLEEADTPLIVGHSGLVRAVRWLAHGTPAGPRSANAVPLWIAPEGAEKWTIRALTPADLSSAPSQVTACQRQT